MRKTEVFHVSIKKSYFKMRKLALRNKTYNTEAKRCFATHDEDIDYFNMRIYYFNRMRIYSTVQLCLIPSL